MYTQSLKYDNIDKKQQNLFSIFIKSNLYDLWISRLGKVVHITLCHVAISNTTYT